MSSSRLHAHQFLSKLVNAGCVPPHKEIDALRVLHDLWEDNVFFSLTVCDLQETLLQHSKKLEAKDAATVLGQWVRDQKKVLESLLQSATAAAQSQTRDLTRTEWLWVAERYAKEKSISFADIRPQLEEFIGYECPASTVEMLGAVAWLREAESYCTAIYEDNFSGIKQAVAEHVMQMTPSAAVEAVFDQKKGRQKKRKKQPLNLAPPSAVVRWQDEF